MSEVAQLSNSEQPSKNNKLHVDIYVPLGVCACQWETFMNSVFQALTEYKDLVQFETKNLQSDEARALNLHGNSIVVDGEKIITSAYAFKNKLPDLLKEKGLI